MRPTLAVLTMCGVAAVATASVSDITSFVDAPRQFNDRPDSSLFYSSSFSPSNGSLTIRESAYGPGGFANRHAAWFGDSLAKVDFDYGDGWDMKTSLRINAADAVDNLEVGFQADLFGFGMFGVLTANGEIAAFGSVLPFHSFGTGLYNIGDDIMLRMIHRPGDGEGSGGAASTMEYMYNNLTTGSGWVSSGQVAFTTLEGGIPSSFDMFLGVGAQINNPDPTLGNVDIEFSSIMIPAPGAAALLGLGGLAAARRRR